MVYQLALSINLQRFSLETAKLIGIDSFVFVSCVFFSFVFCECVCVRVCVCVCVFFFGGGGGGEGVLGFQLLSLSGP